MSYHNCCPAVTVGMVADGLSDCSTTEVRGLSTQILHQLHCDHPGVLDEIHSIEQLCMSSSLLPYLDRLAVRALRTAVNQSTDSFSVTSSLRTLAEQYVLYQWSSYSRCGHTETEHQPGSSEHMKGVAVDILQYQQFKQLASKIQFHWQGDSNPTRFSFSGSTFDIQGALIRSFQKLWNTNHPTEKVVEDGVYGPQTEAALRRTAANGFRQIPTCSFQTPVVPCCVSMKSRGVCVSGNRCHSGNVVGYAYDCVNQPSTVCCKKIQTFELSFYELLALVDVGEARSSDFIAPPNG